VNGVLVEQYPIKETNARKRYDEKRIHTCVKVKTQMRIIQYDVK